MKKFVDWLIRNGDSAVTWAGLGLILTAILFASGAFGCTLDNSFLGKKTEPVDVGTQYISGDLVYLHIEVGRLADAKPVTVMWYRNGKLVKKSSIKGLRRRHYSTISIKALPGEWTAIVEDAHKNRRTHNFVVRRKV